MNRFFRSIVPAVWMALCVGQVYAFTDYAAEIAAACNASPGAVQFAFSLAIFFLGSGAAFFGRFVERDITAAAISGTSLFVCGLLLTAVGIKCGLLWLVWLGYGVLGGLGTGIIYLTPVKTLMLWYPGCRALAGAVSIVSVVLVTPFTILYETFVVAVTPAAT